MLLPYGAHVLALHGYPKLIEPSTGEVVRERPEVESGRRDLCYGSASQPPAAVRADGGAFAVADVDSITVVVAETWDHR